MKPMAKCFHRAIAAATISLLSSPVLSFSIASRTSLGPSLPSSRSTTCRRRQHVSFDAALVMEQDGSTSPDQGQKRVGWHRNVLKSVFRPNGSSNKKSSIKLNQATISASLLGDVATSSEGATDFLLRNFERQTPSSLFGTNIAATNTVDLASFNPSDSPIRELAADVDDVASSVGRSPLTRITSSVAESILTGLIDRLTNGEHSSLSVKCAPNGNALDLLRGHFRSDASVEFGKIAFNDCIRMTGGRLEAQRLAVNLFSRRQRQQQLSQDTERKQRRRRPRWLNQFDFVAHDILFTQDDLFESGCVRNGLRRLLTRILKKHMSISKVRISSIKILRNGKIAIRGDASASFGLAPVDFEVRSAIGTSSRGHVVTFPGLEIALGPTLGMFVPVLPEVSLDLGHNAQIVAVETTTSACGKPALRVSARATITPLHTLKLHKKYTQLNKSYAAPFSVDVGQWLTCTGNFAH